MAGPWRYWVHFEQSIQERERKMSLWTSLDEQAHWIRAQIGTSAVLSLAWNKWQLKVNWKSVTLTPPESIFLLALDQVNWSRMLNNFQNWFPGLSSSCPAAFQIQTPQLSTGFLPLTLLPAAQQVNLQFCESTGKNWGSKILQWLWMDGCQTWPEGNWQI